jgi:hypothetical protein
MDTGGDDGGLGDRDALVFTPPQEGEKRACLR